SGEADVLARIRHRDPATPARLKFAADGGAEVLVAQAQRGIAPGQVLAVYHDRVLLGGGVFL
ncbi:MAG: aminomethyltransferase beta-barrel domain-containing protein, partial [Opitutia bacterium]